MTAENLLFHRVLESGFDRRFNEAAADDRGKPTAALMTATPQINASMRPRPMTAENPGPSLPPQSPTSTLQ